MTLQKSKICCAVDLATMSEQGGLAGGSIGTVTLDLIAPYLLPVGSGFLLLPLVSAFAFNCVSSLLIFAMADLSSAISARAAAKSWPAAASLS